MGVKPAWLAVATMGVGWSLFLEDCVPLNTSVPSVPTWARLHVRC